MPNDYGISSDKMLILAASVFILPFLLLSPWAGSITAHVNKVRWIRLVKMIEAGVMLCAALVISTNIPFATTLLLILLFLMGGQSALFSPVKFGILPLITRGNSMIRANAMIEGSTFVALILGMLIGTALMEAQLAWVLCIGLLCVSAIGLLVALNLNFHDETAPLQENTISFKQQIQLIRKYPALVLSIALVSWFWSIASILSVELPFIVTNVLDAPFAITLFMLALVLGIITGNFSIAHLSKRLPEETLLKIALKSYICMGGLLLVFSVLYGILSTQDAIYFSSGQGIITYVPVMLLWLNLLCMTVCAGIFSVPIFTRLFRYTNENQLTLVIGQNNFWNALAIIALSIFTLGLLSLMALHWVLLVLVILHFLLLPLIFMLQSEHWQKALLRSIFNTFYRAKVSGLEHYPHDQKGLLIASNHVSYLDAPLLIAYLPHKPVFVIDRAAMNIWWIRIWLGACEVYPIDPTHPFSFKTIIKLLEQGRHVMIFPEGAISHTGQLGKIYPGLGAAAHAVNVPVLGVRIGGLAATIFGRLPMERKRLFAPVTLDIAPPMRLDVPEGLSRKQRRHYLIDEVELYLREVMFAASPYRTHLFTHLLECAKLYGLKRLVIEDMTSEPMSYKRLLLGSVLLGKHLSAFAPVGGGVGVLLPNSQAVAATFFALQAYDRVAVMLNFSAGETNLFHAIKLSGISTVVTSRRFVNIAQLEACIERLSSQVRIVYLEDMREKITLGEKLLGLWPLQLVKRNPTMQRAPEETAVVLFTSGSEGIPKGVALSHQNIIANIYQSFSVTNVHTTDRLFNPLPVFHCFGLVAGMIFPLYAGARSFQFPSPLQYRQIADLIYHWRPTVVFGADSFLQRYGAVAHALDMSSLRLVVAGAEKLKDETRRLWYEKFGLMIYQGYGATEASPVIAVNTPRFHLPGSVGMPLPGIECRLQPVPELNEPYVGVLEVRGPNVMRGYISPDNPESLEPLPQGWYNTGDIVQMSREGYITILGRQKRFAKIAGEMISLDQVESLVQQLWPEASHAALVRYDQQRGEKILLITTQADATKQALIDHWSKYGHSRLSGPAQVIVVEDIPLLATGKIDYFALKQHFATI